MRETFSNDEISIFEIYTFFSRQIKVIAIVFLLTFAIGIAYATTRPTLYTSTSSVTVGNSISLVSNDLSPLEKPEEMTYKYSKVSAIKPIKNTNIVEVSSTTEDRRQSIENVKLTIKEIIENQKTIYQTQEQQLIKYMELLWVTDNINTKILDLLQTASRSSATNSSEIVTTKHPYSGKLKINLVLACVIAMIISFCVGGIKGLSGQSKRKSGCAT